MNPGKLIFLALLSIFSATVHCEIISLTCGAPGKTGEEKLVLDTEQMVVRFKHKRGNIGLIDGDNVYYYLKYGPEIVTYRLGLADGVLDVAASKKPPEEGYTHDKLVCRRT